MIKKAILYFTILTLILSGCATKSYVLSENERLTQEIVASDSTLLVKILNNSDRHHFLRDSLYNDLNAQTEGIIIDLMGELYLKSFLIDSLETELSIQSDYLQNLTSELDTLQALETKFKDADYSMHDLSRISGDLDSLNLNQKKLSRDLNYMIRDLGLIERNLMDIMNYSMSSLKNTLQASTMMFNRALYKHNATANKMIMIYLMTNSPSEPNSLLAFIDSVYSLGPALDTMEVYFGLPDTTSGK
ncbi:MAG: hypothetical protein WCT23_04790 [Candidatus Neomarinimicrobiota bacterium]